MTHPSLMQIDSVLVVQNPVEMDWSTGYVFPILLLSRQSAYQGSVEYAIVAHHSFTMVCMLQETFLTSINASIECEMAIPLWFRPMRQFTGPNL